jgi:diaminopimelate epimerase
MKIPFTKMHGIGNDYIYVNCMKEELPNPNDVSFVMSPRHFSVGADGLVMICSSEIADAKMRMFNADGSEGKMCGNAIRCVGKYLYDNGIVAKEKLSIETLSGIKYLNLNVENGRVASVEVDMGKAILTPSEIPVIFDGERMIDAPVEVKGKTYRLTAVSMGNPHAVTFMDEIDSLDLEKMGPDFENLSIFPDRVNTEFVRVIDSETLQMRVWERGSGETFACGTGACATVVAAILNGICKIDTPITVRLRGGELKIVCDQEMRVFMTGPAQKAYEGVFEYEDSDQ